MDNLDKDFIKILQEIKYDIGNASLEDVDEILNRVWTENIYESLMYKG